MTKNGVDENVIAVDGEPEEEGTLTFVGEGFELRGRLYRNGVLLFNGNLPQSIPLLAPQMTQEEKEDAMRMTQEGVAAIGGIDLTIEEL
jgi:hypothetical protein